MIIKNFKKNNKGFVILFAVTISSIVLSIVLGVSNIAFREIKFGTSVKDTNEAFFAADTGIELALYNERFTPYNDGEINYVAVDQLGISGKNCAKISINKTDTSTTPMVTFISKGYNVGNNNNNVPLLGFCASSDPNRIEREVKVSYYK